MATTAAAMATKRATVPSPRPPICGGDGVAKASRSGGSDSAEHEAVDGMSNRRLNVDYRSGNNPSELGSSEGSGVCTNSEEGGYEEDGEGEGSSSGSGKETSGSTEEGREPSVSDGEYGGGDERSSSFDGANDGDEDDMAMSQSGGSLNSSSSGNDESPEGAGEGGGSNSGSAPERRGVEAC